MIPSLATSQGRSVCSLFLRREGSITCQVSGSRRYLDDLVQGGLEIPCVLVFEGDEKVTAKAKKRVELALSTTTINLLAKKKRKVTDISAIVPHISEDSISQEWIQFSKGLVLSVADKKHILAGEKLDDFCCTH